ncbi:hypothetical protein AB0B89_30915 [Sphaerisporangium sp. NPDC049002]|uniref:hypothetical protein n=1 Tax=Sphaerisporangium sp. NPDC049002 TaxID=3155392 RepID=UPI0033C3CFBB
MAPTRSRQPKVVPKPGDAQPKLVGKLDDASKVVKAATGLTDQAVRLVRQLVHLAGWIVLLISTVKLVIDPPQELAAANFLGHGAGAAAVLQGVVKVPARWRKAQTPSLPEAIETPKALEPP